MVCCTLQDGHHEIWEQEYVAGIVGAEVERRDIETVCPKLAARSNLELASVTTLLYPAIVK